MSSEQTQQPEGRWVHPTGASAEIMKVPGGWRFAVSLTRTSRGTVGDVLLTSEAELREKIAWMREQGYIRAAPGVEIPRAPLQPMQVMGVIAMAIGAVMIVAVIVLLFA